MVLITENAALREHALAYVNEVYRELRQENGAANLGTQNQAVDFILADPQLSEAVMNWAASGKAGAVAIGEASTAPPRPVPKDALYQAVRSRIDAAIGPAPPHSADLQ